MILSPPSGEQILAAQQRIAGIAVRTPLVTAGSDRRVRLKLENLQPIGSFKIRGAANAMRSLPSQALADGVYTASAGNMAQGVAWCARELGVPCRVIVPDAAPAVKIDAIERLGGEIIKVPFVTWWQAMLDHGMAGVPGRFVHPFADPDVIAGNATIGQELVEDAADLQAVIVPWGGGGLACGIAAALRLMAPAVRVYAVEVITAAPLHASFAAGQAETIEPTRSFVDGIGGRSVVNEMWPMAQALLAGTLVVTVAEVAQAVRALAMMNRVVAEGAGAAALAAVLAGQLPDLDRMACIVSGGNINTESLAAILRGADG
ncbi:MAG TPA: pyridoxal-phosphate dependent enzyme [Gemmatimonadales bacterium]|jgi:threonine dehydratase